MDDKSFNIRVPKKWVRVGMIVTVTALIVAPLTAIASHSFTDVPDSNTFHEDIAWLADADVTRGCNPPDNTEFCPDDEVTRGQMSAFMRRFSQYIGAEDGTPALADHATTADNATTADSAATAADADTVDGFDANNLVRAAGAASDTPSTDNGTVESVTIEAPVNGFLYVSSNTEASDADEWFCRINLNGDQAPESGYTINVHSGVDGRAACPNTMLLPVEAGDHTVDLVVGNVDGNLNESSLSVLFVPFGSDGAAPTSFADLSNGTGDNDE